MALPGLPGEGVIGGEKRFASQGDGPEKKDRQDKKGEDDTQVFAEASIVHISPS